MGQGVFDKVKADTLIRRLESLKLPNGKPLSLIPWQADFIRTILGTIDPETGLRQYRRGSLWIAAQNGKTLVAACIVLLFLMDPKLKAAALVTAGPTRKQAAYIHKMLKDIIEQDPRLSAKLKVYNSTKRIINVETSTVYEAISGKSNFAEGLSLKLVILDEVHAFTKSDLHDTLSVRLSAQDEALFLSLSTAGNDPNPGSFGYQEYEYSRKVRDGILPAPRFLPVIYCAEDSDDPFSIETVRKANPSLGVTVKLEEVAQEQEKAKHSPSTLRKFRRYTLNQWTAPDGTWLDLDLWQSGAGTVDLEALKGQTAYLGCDYGERFDLTAAVLLFPQGKKDARSYLCYPFFFCPEQILGQKEGTDGVTYREWVKSNHIIPTPGNATDLPTLRRKIEELASQYQIRIIALDKWGLIQMAEELRGAGHSVALVDQRWYKTSAALKEIERLLVAKKLTHPDHPVLNWNAGNCRVIEGQAGDIRIEKMKTTKRIDGIAALANAMFAALSEVLPDGSEEPADLAVTWI